MKSARRLALTLGLVVAYMFAEVIGGLLTNSLALLADAGHMLSDAAALALSLFAAWIARRPAPPQRTYGYYRAEILAALANGATLIAVSILVVYEAYERFIEPPRVLGGTMLAIAAGGLAVNLAGLAILHGAREATLNTRGAWLHVLGDTAGSIGVIVAALAIWRLDWHWADPVASVVIGALVLWSSWNLLKVTVAVLMEQSPGHIDVDQVRGTIMSMEGVRGVHDLHIWTITTGLESLSAHVTIARGLPAADLLRDIRRTVDERFGIDLVTIQLEPEGFEEHLAPL